MEIRELKEKARELRVDIIRMLAEAGSGHPGGSLSCTDIITALFFKIMRHDPKNPSWPQRDRLVLSKGHGVPALYAALAHSGYFPREELLSLRKLGSRLQGHPDRVVLPCLEASTGSLGQGLSVAQGIALAGKLDKADFRVYCIVGDGETQEGQIWEAAMSAPKFGLDNLTTILDYNKGQIDGFVCEVMPIEPVSEKWKAFGWQVKEIDGHDFDQILGALEAAKATKGRPSLIVAHTVKGKGVSFMENVVDWHGKGPSKEEASKALAELAAS